MADLQQQQQPEPRPPGSGKARAQRPQCGVGFGGKSVGLDVEAEDWCDSGLDSFSCSTLGSEPDPMGAWKTAPASTSLGPARDPQDSGGPTCPDPQTSDTCVSLGGDRLDSALGDSITDELLGSLSEGIGTLGLGDTGGGPVGPGGRAQELLVTEELFNTLTFVSEDGDTALHLALIHEHWAFLQYLLSVVSLDPAWTQYLDTQNHLGQTALHIAVIVNQPECVRGLLCVGASPDLQERSGNTALHIACREGLRECVRELVSHSLSRAPLHTTNYAGVTPLHIAVQKVDEEAVRLLLDAGADANRRDLSSGRTALHWAVESQSAPLVRLLLSRGAAVDAPSYAGHTPLYCALHRPSEAVRSLLREEGAVEPLEEDEEEDDEEEDDEEEEDELERKEEEFDDLVINGHRVL